MKRENKKPGKFLITVNFEMTLLFKVFWFFLCQHSELCITLNASLQSYKIFLKFNVAKQPTLKQQHCLTFHMGPKSSFFLPVLIHLFDIVAFISVLSSFRKYLKTNKSLAVSPFLTFFFFFPAFQLS